eukprot:Selendium_serpulae@DN4633_c0_g1_i1.p1
MRHSQSILFFAALLAAPVSSFDSAFDAALLESLGDFRTVNDGFGTVDEVGVRFGTVDEVGVRGVGVRGIGTVDEVGVRGVGVRGVGVRGAGPLPGVTGVTGRTIVAKEFAEFALSFPPAVDFDGYVMVHTGHGVYTGANGVHSIVPFTSCPRIHAARRALGNLSEHILINGQEFWRFGAGMFENGCGVVHAITFY